MRDDKSSSSRKEGRFALRLWKFPLHLKIIFVNSDRHWWRSPYTVGSFHCPSSLHSPRVKFLKNFHDLWLHPSNKIVGQKDVFRDPIISHLLFVWLIRRNFSDALFFPFSVLLLETIFIGRYKPIIPTLYTVHNSSFATQKDHRALIMEWRNDSIRNSAFLQLWLLFEKPFYNFILF